MLRYSSILCLLIFFFSCSKDKADLVNVIPGTWDASSKRCGLYELSENTFLNFTIDTTSYTGWVKEQDKDTVFFTFSVPNNNEVVINDMTNSNWNGSLQVDEYSTNKLVFYRPKQECDGEKWTFKK